MSKEEKYYCSRCGADLTKKPFNCYASEVDRKLICLDCFQKEQPKYLVNKISDLEAKLAEHNEYFRSFICENFNEFQDFISTFMLTPHEEQTLIRELKQQLAEKEKEIEKQNRRISLLEKYKNDQKIRANDYYKQCKKANQDKISFALERLEKVKEYAIHIQGGLINYIDNQIKQLKEGK